MTEQEKNNRDSLHLMGDDYAVNIYKYDNTAYGVYGNTQNGTNPFPHKLFEIESDAPVNIYTVADRVSMAFALAGWGDTPENYDEDITQEEIDDALDFNEVIEYAEDLMSSKDARDFWGVA